MKGLTVKVRAKSGTGKDALGNPVAAWGKPEDVSSVLVAAGATMDQKETNRPEGVTVAYTLVFPKTFTGSLRGCQIQVPGDSEWYEVVGDPKAQPDGQMALSYNRRNRTVEVTRGDG